MNCILLSTIIWVVCTLVTHAQYRKIKIGEKPEPASLPAQELAPPNSGLPTPSVYPYIGGKSQALVTSSTWRAEGDRIVGTYALGNPGSEELIIRAYFQSKTTPGRRFAATSVTGAIGKGPFAERSNLFVWDYHHDQPTGLPKDEYEFAFEVLPVQAPLQAPPETFLYTVITRAQSFIVACPEQPVKKGIQVVRGADQRTSPAQVLSGI